MTLRDLTVTVWIAVGVVAIAWALVAAYWWWLGR